MRLLLFLALIFPLLLDAQNEKSLSPYFIINTDSTGELPDFPLKLNAADVSISGVIADVKITQVYVNHSKKPLEALYIFPASTRAAVYAMEMKVGRRTIKAEIRKKDEARAEYADAKQAGKTASLLEETRPNIFQMNVANIMPGDSIIVKLFYTELIVPENEIYEFVYPTVVGPRYEGIGGTSELSTPNVSQQGTGTPYTKAGIMPLYNFDMHVRMESPVPFEFIESSSHKILLSFEEKSAANILLSPEEKDGGNRDFVLRYKLSGASIKTGMMTTQSGGENFFMFMMQPPARVALDSIPPREYIFVMDVSGSMNGFPIATSKTLLQNLISGLRPTDIFNVVLFAGGSQQFNTISVPATKKYIDSALAFIAKETGNGGTELRNAMNSAMSIPKQQGFSRTIVVATDGYISAEADVFKSIHEHLDEANVFAFGIGTAVNRYLIEGIAFAGNGETFVVDRSGNADAAAEKFRTYISSPVLTNIKVAFGTMDVYDVEPIHVADLFAQRPIIITGKYHGKAGGEVTVTGITGKLPYKSVISLDKINSGRNNSAIKYLWARQKITFLDYQNSFAGRRDSSAIAQITELGLKYSLLTNYTSFIAVDDQIRNKDGVNDSTVTQPLPLPQGVPNSAVGMNANKNINTVSIISGGVPAQFGDASGGIVNISSFSGATDIQECVMSMPCIALVLPPAVQVDFTVNATSANFVLSDMDRFCHGGMPATTLTNSNRPFFDSRFSSRVGSVIPVSWIGNYSFNGINGVPKGGGFDPERKSDFIFNTYGQRSIATLSLTDFGQEEFGFEWYGHEKNNWRSSTKVNERWLGLAADRNHDSFLDVPKQTGVSAFQNFNYSNYEKRLSYFQNSTFVNTSVFESGQKKNDSGNPLYMNRDSLTSICNTTEMQIKMWGEHVLQIGTVEGWAQRSAHIGNTNYFSAAPFGSARVYYSKYFNETNLDMGVVASYFGGKEMLNGERFGKDHSEILGYSNFTFAFRNLRTKLGLESHNDSRFGNWLTPTLSINWNKDYLRVNISGSRVRGSEMTVGSLLPLLYSARTLSMPNELLPDDGWFGKALTEYTHNFPNNRYLGFIFSYSMMQYNRVTLVDLDSHAGVIDIYTAGKQPLHHNVSADVTLRYNNRWEAKFFYQYNLRINKYQSLSLLEPLLPQHLISGKIAYTSRNLAWKANISAKYVSRQRLPGHGFAENFATMNLHGEHLMGRWTVTCDVLNVLNYRQQTTIYNAQDVWGNSFDASMSAGPVIGRIFQVGVVYRIRE